MEPAFKFVSIETFSKDDLKDLFDHICKHILKHPPNKIREDVLGLKGSAKELNAHNPTINSILTLIATYDLKFEFTIKYIEDVEPDFDDIPVIPKNRVQTLMEKQKEEIINDEPPLIMDGKPVEVVYVDNSTPEEKKEINEDELPDFSI